MFRRDWDPMSHLAELRREMDRVFDNVVGSRSFGPVTIGRTYPAVNVWEDAECVYVEAEVPGLGIADVDIQVVGSELTLRGQRNVAEVAGATYHRQERGAGEFCRHVSLPVEVNAEKVNATLKDGVLTIVFPKVEGVKPRKIHVKSS